MSKVNNNEMEKCSKSHGKKSDKETHTPMLKIFKDMMQLEKNDPEKANLLKDKESNKKRKKYTASRSKSDFINRSCDSSSSDRHRVPQVIDHREPQVIDHREPQVTDHREYDVQRHGIAKLTGMKPSKKEAKRSESTTSGISCALKRLATSEYTCITCLGILFAITVIVAFCMVFKNPCAVKTNKDRVGRTIFKRDFGEAGLKEGLDDRNDWDDSKLGRYGDLSMTDMDDSSSRGLNRGSSNRFTDLSRIIDVSKLNYGKSSERLKSFYKKLLQTDEQIKNMKKGMIDSTYSNMKIPDRKKRSVKRHHFQFNNVNNRRNEQTKRNKRYLNYTAPTGFVIEKKRIMIHLPNEKKIVPKCSHAPKDSKSHETELKHPFYKHTQRLDELLDKFLDKNIPHIFGDFNLDSIFKTNKAEDITRKNIATHEKGSTNVDIITDSYIMSSPSDFFKITNTDKAEADVVMGVTTVMSPPKKSLTKSLLERVPNIRKLLQVFEDDEENLGYEDLKEVLADDVESHDETEIQIDRNKRSYETDPNPLESPKSNPAGVQIPNWKGPFPLYPDELNTMIKGRTENANKPITRDSSKGDVMFTDVEYIEDYLTNKYDKLENMAQAYSDYGVLDEKKETKDENPKSDNTDNRVKWSLDVPKLIDRFKKGTTESQNIYFSQPSSKQYFGVPKFLKKHVNIVNKCPESTPTALKDNSFDTQKKFKFDKSAADKQDISSIPEKHSFENNHKHLRLDRSVKDILSNVTLDDDLEKRSVKSIDTTASVTVKASKNVSLDENNSFQKDFDIGDSNNTNICKVTTIANRDSKTPITNNDNIFKRRSLKSIEENDRDKVIDIQEYTTMEKLTTEFNENSNTFNIFSVQVKNKNAVVGADDNFVLETSTQGVTTYMNVPITIATEQYKPDELDHVNVLSIENITREKSIKINDPRTNLDAQKRILNIVNLANSHNSTRIANDGMDLSDFFRMISTWFSSLASASLDDNDNNSGTMNPIMNLKTSVTPIDVTSLDFNKSDIHYPSYDSDMIDNIGHRSRVLMSVEEAGNVTEKKETYPGTGEYEEKRNADLQHANTTETSENHVLTTLNEPAHAVSEGDKNSIDNKSVAKRSLGDSGLVFWSDLYDDEYGIKVDPLEKELAGKNENRGKEFMKRSKNWFQDKVKSIADNIKGFRNNGETRKTHDDNNRNSKYSHIFKRQTATDKNDKTEAKVTNFAELTAKMKNVVKEAAKAVQQTRKMQVRESKDDSVATGIMQQLVRMMSDLVNYQVQQKTCVKLPADLQNFLEWITHPNEDHQSSRQINLQDNRVDDTTIFEKDKDIDSPLKIQDKTECLETIHALEDLIQQYDQMDDEDKSKMSGVKQYLENQLEFLNNQLSMMDEFNFSNIYADQPPVRYRRHLTTQKTSTLKSNNLRGSMKRRLRKLFSNFGKKHKKSTLSPYISKSSKGYNKNKNLNINEHGNNNKKGIIKELDDNFKKQDNVIENKVHKTNTITRKDNIKRFKDEDALLNNEKGSSEEIEKVSTTNDNSNSPHLSNEKLEQNYNLYSTANDQQYALNKDDEVERNDDIVKRNLQDVYYRALYESKKVTTVKNIDKS